MAPQSRGLSISVCFTKETKVVLEFYSALSITQAMVGLGCTKNGRIRIIQNMRYIFLLFLCPEFGTNG